MAYGLKEADIQSVIDVLASNSKLKQVILFGSRAKGTFHNGSDIDLALLGEHLNLTDLTAWYELLDELPLLYKFDLVIFDRITEPKLIDHIQRVGITLFERK